MLKLPPELQIVLDQMGKTKVALYVNAISNKNYSSNSYQLQAAEGAAGQREKEVGSVREGVPDHS